MEKQNNKQAGLPDTPQKILGSYPQKQPGLYMQRIPVFGGRLDIGQWAAIVDIARRFSSSPLHLTTRQDVELHDIPEADMPSVYRALYEAGLDTYGACGDCVRNITICPASDYDDTAADILPLAKLVREALFSRPAMFPLPRKFKVSFSGCFRACGRPFVNDLGFVANRDGTFRAIGAGSLGAHPQTGIELYPSLTAQEVVWLSVAALELFAELGDRQNRRKARLRHVRQRLGDLEFRRRLHDQFEKTKQTFVVPVLKMVPLQRGVFYRTTLQWVTGEISLDTADLLTQACRQNAAAMRINLTHGIELFSSSPIILSEPLRQYENLPAIVACPGSDTCTNGLTATRTLARQFAQRLTGSRWKGKTIAISGCPNRCAQCAVADIGLTGCMKTIDGQRQQAYQLFTGGGCGKNADIAEAGEIFSVEQILAKVVLL